MARANAFWPTTAVGGALSLCVIFRLPQQLAKRRYSTVLTICPRQFKHNWTQLDLHKRLTGVNILLACHRLSYSTCGSNSRRYAGCYTPDHQRVDLISQNWYDGKYGIQPPILLNLKGLWLQGTYFNIETWEMGGNNQPTTYFRKSCTAFSWKDLSLLRWVFAWDNSRSTLIILASSSRI